MSILESVRQTWSRTVCKRRKKKTHHTSNKLKTKILLLLANFRRATFKLEIILISICFIRAQRYKQTNVGELTDGHGVVVFGRKWECAWRATWLGPDWPQLKAWLLMMQPVCFLHLTGPQVLSVPLTFVAALHNAVRGLVQWFALSPRSKQVVGSIPKPWSCMRGVCVFFPVSAWHHVAHMSSLSSTPVQVVPYSLGCV